MPIDDQEQLKQQIYDYLESIGWKMISIEDMDYNALVDCLHHQAQISEANAAALRRGIGDILRGILRLHSQWCKLIEFLHDGASTYDDDVLELANSISEEFAQFAHSADIEIQSAKERPAESGTESSPCQSPPAPVP